MIDIIVSAAGFIWKDEASRYLLAAGGCAQGVCRLIRRGKVIDTAEVRRDVPGQPCIFYGLQKIFGSPYNERISASRFALGDRLEIDIPNEMTERAYWDEMVS